MLLSVCWLQRILFDLHFRYNIHCPARYLINNPLEPLGTEHHCLRFQPLDDRNIIFPFFFDGPVYGFEKSVLFPVPTLKELTVVEKSFQQTPFFAEFTHVGGVFRAGRVGQVLAQAFQPLDSFIYRTGDIVLQAVQQRLGKIPGDKQIPNVCIPLLEGRQVGDVDTIVVDDPFDARIGSRRKRDRPSPPPKLFSLPFGGHPNPLLDP